MVKDFIPTTENVLQVCEAIATEEEQKIKDNADDILHWLIVCDRPVSMKLENVIASRFEAFRDKVIGILSQKDYENEENLALLEAVLRVFLFNLEKIDVREFEKELNILYSENSPIPQKEKSIVCRFINDIFVKDKQRKLYLQVLQDLNRGYSYEQIFDKYTENVENCKNFKRFIIYYYDKINYPNQFSELDFFHLLKEDSEKIFDICIYVVERRKEMAKDFIPIHKSDLDACEQILRAKEQDLKDNADEILHWLDVGTSELLPKLFQAIVERFDVFKDGIKKILSKRPPLIPKDIDLINGVIGILSTGLRRIDIFEFNKNLQYFISDNSPLNKDDKEDIEFLFKMDEYIKLHIEILNDLANGYNYEQIKDKYQDDIDSTMCKWALKNNQEKTKFYPQNWVEVYFSKEESKSLLNLFEYLLKGNLDN